MRCRQKESERLRAESVLWIESVECSAYWSGLLTFLGGWSSELGSKLTDRVLLKGAKQQIQKFTPKEIAYYQHVLLWGFRLEKSGDDVTTNTMNLSIDDGTGVQYRLMACYFSLKTGPVAHVAR